MLFFMLWMMQLALMTQSTSSALPVLMVFDFSGPSRWRCWRRCWRGMRGTGVRHEGDNPPSGRAATLGKNYCRLLHVLLLQSCIDLKSICS